MLRAMSGLGVLGLACAGVLLEAAPAAACGETPCAQRGQTLPEGSGSPVPTNTEIRIEHSGFVDAEAAGIGCSIPIHQVRLAAVGGEPSDVAAVMQQDAIDYPSTWMVSRPPELEPNTTYVVTSLHAGDGQCSCEEPDYVEVMRFVTGDGPDEDAPATPEVRGFSSTTGVRSETTCGTFHKFSITFEIEAAADASPSTRFNVYADGAIVRRYVEGDTITVALDCLEDEGEWTPEATMFALTAVDLAGNESEQTATVDVGNLCVGLGVMPSSDGGALPVPDASVVEDADGGSAIEVDAGAQSRPVVPATQPEDRNNGEDCSASGASGGGWNAAWMLVALIFARRSRKR